MVACAALYRDLIETDERAPPKQIDNVAARKQSSKGEILPSSADGKPPVGFPLEALHERCRYELRSSGIPRAQHFRLYGSVRCGARTVRRALGYQILEVNNHII